jgi:hypothetical protein
LFGVEWGHVRRLGKNRGDVQRTLRAIVAFMAAVALLTTPPPVHAKQKNARNASTATSSPAVPDTPLILVVSIRNQKLRVYDADGEITSSRVSTGRPGFDTPTGVFSILEKNVRHQSNIYSGAEMPYMQRITWSGVALHAGVVPGFRASHGCIRLPYSFSKTLYGMTKVGARVIVAPDDVEPIAFDSPKLFKPLPLDDQTAMRSDSAKKQLAINDQGSDSATTDALLELPRFIGVSPALARAVADMPRDPQRRPTTRIEADQMMQEKISRFKAAIKSADAARVAASEKVKATSGDFNAASERLEAARRALEPLRAAVTTAENRQRDAVRAFEDYMSGQSLNSAMGSSLGDGGAADQGVLGRSQDREKELEVAVLEWTREADRARAEAAKAELSLAEVQASYSVARAVRDAALAAVEQAQSDMRAAQAGLADANKEAALRVKPISVLVSLRAQRIYIRRGFEPMLEAPISVNPLPGRVGTHVFTAMRYGSDPNTFEWKLVSAQIPPPGQPFEADSKKKKRSAEPSSPWSQSRSVEMAAAALEAFTIPDDILATISENARPGASLIVSDRELPLNENGSGTEFVVLTR